MNYYDKEELAKETKEILEYFFLEQPDDFVANSSRKQQKFSSKKTFEKLLTHKQKYVDRVWDENHTIVNFLLFHQDFRLSNTRLNELAKITNDWSSPNDKGENALFCLMKKDYEVKKIIELIQTLNINAYQKNTENLYFVNYFFKEEKVDKVLIDFEKRVNNFPEIRLNKYFNTYIDLIENFPQLFKETADIEKEKLDKVKSKIMSYDFKGFNNNKIGINLEDTLQKLDKIFMYLQIDNKLKTKNIKEQKLKI